MRFASGIIQRKNADNKAVKGSRAKRCSIIIIKDHEYEYDAKECSKGFKGVIGMEHGASTKGEEGTKKLVEAYRKIDV